MAMEFFVFYLLSYAMDMYWNVMHKMNCNGNASNLMAFFLEIQMDLPQQQQWTQ